VSLSIRWTPSSRIFLVKKNLAKIIRRSLRIIFRRVAKAPQLPGERILPTGQTCLRGLSGKRSATCRRSHEWIAVMEVQPVIQSLPLPRRTRFSVPAITTIPTIATAVLSLMLNLLLRWASREEVYLRWQSSQLLNGIRQQEIG
jgi:hypothetical protein